MSSAPPSVAVQSERQKFLAYNARRNDPHRRLQDFENELRYVHRLKPLASGVKLLDVGCGPGVFTEFWIDNGVDAAGVDLDGALVLRARERLTRRGVPARFAVGRVEALPYRSGTFDVCVANALLEHVPDWQSTLREATRVLKDDGLLVFSTTNKLHPFQSEVNNFPFYSWLPERLKRPILAAIMKHRPWMVNYTSLPAVHWFTYEGLRAFLEGLGYDVRTRVDMLRRSELTGWKAAAKPVLRLLQSVGLLRYVYYFYSSDVSIYALKRAR
jgi:2-polyprenyl-6-hydroxyphenyl methylase/3-demethylubiquinone-9 3-methyltransferase